MPKINLYKALFLLAVFSIVELTAQQLPPISSFHPEEYKAQNQNWAISQAKDKTVYIANNSGLLAYNGASWKLYKSPNNTIVRSVNVVEDKIYTGCYMEFGFWKKNQFNLLEYTSLSKPIKDKLIEDEQFWNILEFENKILFQSLNRLYIYDVNKTQFDIINSVSVISKVFKISDGIFFQEINKGLFKIEKGKKVLVASDKIIQENRVVGLFDNDNSVLLLTENKGFFKLVNSKLVPWKTFLDVNKNLGVYNAIQLKDKSFALGTISNGLIHLDENGQVQYQINQNKGLNNNTVLSLFEDSDNDIWLGLDNGINLVNQQSPFKIYNDFNGKLGSVYTSIIFEDVLYLGTNQGLFYKSINSKNHFKFIEETQGQVWSLRNINGTLFCGHNNGTFIVSNKKVNKILNTEGTWDFKKIDDNRILQGNYNGLFLLEKNNNSWSIKNKVKGFDISSKYFEILNNNQVFVNHEYKGVLKLSLNNEFSEVLKSEEDSIKKSTHSSLVKFLNTLYYANENGIFKYNTTKSTFKKDTVLSKIYKEGYISGKLVVNTKENEMWAFSNSSVVQITPSKLSNMPQIVKIPLASSVRKGVQGYENILKLKDNKYLHCTSDGFIEIDKTKFPIKDFKINLNTVLDSDANSINLKEERVFNSKNNNLTFTYNVAEFDKYLQPNYQFKLEGLSNNWSSWSTNHKKVFENLPSGDYKFRVRAKVGNKMSTNIVSFNFKIEKPWYLSTKMLLVYLVGFLFFLLMMHTVYRSYYKNQQKKLVKENEKEMRLTQLRNEKELIKVRNEKLREDFKSKSKELASSIMSIVKKNELLADIKDQLQKINNKEEVKPVIKSIDKNLKDNADWEFFQEAFNNADSEFLKRLKALHPKLTPNDLKLCAYLRLNLSSKEIAPLFNISPRSVEIKRYRLRKKMNLPHKQNLPDYILNL